jgi:hypothetical protein
MLGIRLQGSAVRKNRCQLSAISSASPKRNISSALAGGSPFYPHFNISVGIVRCL